MDLLMNFPIFKRKTINFTKSAFQKLANRKLKVIHQVNQLKLKTIY